MIKKNNKTRILNFFLDKPTYAFSLRELERLSKLGLPSVKNYVLELEKEDLVKIKIIQRFKLHIANRDNKRFKRLKTSYNIEKLYDSGLIDYLNKELSLPTIILFGSVAKGEDVENSDIDLYIETPEKQLDISKFEREIGKNIQIFFHKTLKEIKNKHLMNNITNGIILEGFLEVF